MNTQKQMPEWQQIVQNLPEDELRDFVTEFAMKNKKLQNDLVNSFPMLEQKDNSAKYRRIISKVFNDFADRNGLIEYSDTSAAMRLVDGLLIKANEYIERNNLREAFSVASAIAHECIEAIQLMDDSDGECGEAIKEAFKIIDAVLEATSNTGFSNEVYEWLYVQMQNDEFNDHGCEETLEDVFFKWSDRPERLKIAYNYIDQQMKKAEGDKSWNAEYDIRKFLKYKLKLLQNEGKSTEVERLINNNKHAIELREIRVEYLLNQKKYKRAIQLIHEGIYIAKRNQKRRFVKLWKERLLDIYQASNNSTLQRELAKDLFVNYPGCIEFYKKYKETFSDTEWVKGFEEIMEIVVKPSLRIQQFRRHFSRNLGQIYIEEKMWKRLFEELVAVDDFRLLSRYFEYLKNDYSTELVSIYRQGIPYFAKYSGSHKYEQLGKFLTQLAGLTGGLPDAKRIKAELLEAHPNRPTMKEEFRKLLI